MSANPSETPKTGMIISGVLASEAIDSSGEILDIKGMDIAILEEGRGVLNYEHQSSDKDPTEESKEENHGEEIVGRILYAKKVFGPDDCSDEDQKMYWKRTKVPFLYGVCRLYDGAGHEGAKSLAANMRDAVASGDPVVVGFSIEGTTLEKKGNVLKSTIARLAAITLKPCNRQAVSGVISDPHAPPGFDKHPGKIHFKSEDPTKQRLGGSELEYSAEMLKALSAGSYNAAPGTLTGGAALQREDRTLKSMALAAKRDWPKTGKFREFLKNYLDKAEMGDVSDEFLDHYSDLVESNYYRVKKTEEVLADLKKAGKVPKVPTAPPATSDVLTNNGVAVKPNKKVTAPTFDENKGVLHMPEGSFKVYIPSQDTPEMASKFHSILNDPKVDQFHSYAMSHWAKAHQLFKAGQTPPEVSMHAVLFSNLSPNCLDAETEALTKRGWIPGFELTKEDELLTKNPATGALEWNRPTDLKFFPDYEGDLVKISGRSFEVITTPAHRWLVDSQRGHTRIKTSTELAAGDRIHRTGLYDGPAISGLTPDEAELLGWFVTDGHWSKAKTCNNAYNSKYEISGIYARLSQSTTGNPEKCARIEALILRLTDEASSHVGSDGKKVWTLGPRLTKILLERAPDRHLTVTALLDLNLQALERLAEGMYLGDGSSWTGRAGWTKKKQLTTGRQEQAQAFQALLTLLGKASSCVWRDMSKYKPTSSKMKNIPNMTGVFVVTELSKHVYFDPKLRTEFKAKMGVWCPMVPNEVFVARRKGQVFCTLNTPVPMQEMMYGHLVDSMKTTGQTPLTEKWPSVKQDWLDRDQPQKFPDHSPEHWKRLESALRLKHDSKTTGRTKGDLGSFMLANDKFDNMTKYAQMHGPLQDLLKRHNGDARGAAEEMMYHKNEQVKWNGRRRIGVSKGKPDIGEYPGMSISGLAPKTARYALAMMGGGNIHVPDTHFTRNLFGLNRNLDGNTIAAIKNVMWNEKNTHILNGIDRYYAKNHDAVKHMLQHPQWGGLFKNPEDAVFPAFWKHWMAIVPHEQARGHTVNGYNELTDHKPFWEAIAPHMKKSEAGSLPMQTAKQHAEWQLQYGEIPAMLLYYRHLLPQLLAAGGQRQAQALVRKAQELQVDFLAKGDRTDISHARDIGKRVQELDAQKAMEGQANSEYAGFVGDREGLKNRPVTFQNRRVQPGHATDTKRGTGYHLLGHSASHFFAIPDQIEPHKGWSDQDLVKIPRASEDLHVKEYPQSVDEPSVVNADIHAVPGFANHPGSRALAHGFDFGSKTKNSTSGAAQASSFWAKDPQGKHLYVKANAQNWMAQGHAEGPWNTARREGVYHNMAHDFFGLGKYVPDVAVVTHPQTGREHALIGHVDGDAAETVDDKTLAKAFGKAGNDIQKMALMNTIMGNNDRHEGNWMVGKDGMKLIDHNLIGSTMDQPMFPSYMHYGNPKNKLSSDSFGDEPLTPETHSWVKSLKPDELRNQLMKYGMPQKSIDYALSRLDYLQKNAHTDKSIERAIDNANSAMSGARQIDDE